MILKAEIKTEFNIINLRHVSAIGTFDDPNGKYFLINFRIESGNVSWKYDTLKQRDDKIAEAMKLMQ
ncbi:MAG TPA: hypothetical protein PK605_09015 [Ignavibacteria bacterium]|nr:hypothetical protein [Bacteroidota bacterium]HRE12278.1 hypothetical protein [Ignavibacteria bacterium]HRF65852.1 hypothetical protein [Ignavibacteria bacterium]HRJ04526.1 hypothetical protein [Ignavibacteria bacterium]